MLKSKKSIKIIAVVSAVLIVIITLGVYFGLRVKYPIKYKQEIIEQANLNQLNVFLVFSLIKVESNFKEDAISNKGAKGLMQITESTAKYIAQMLKEEQGDLLSAKTNIKYGCYYLRYLIKRFKSERTAIIAYNAGEGITSRWLENKEIISSSGEIEKIPYKETEEYVKRIYKSFGKYKKLYKNILDK